MKKLSSCVFLLLFVGVTLAVVDTETQMGFSPSIATLRLVTGQNIDLQTGMQYRFTTVVQKQATGSNVDPQTSISYAFKAGVQKTAADLCTDQQTGMKFNFALRSLSCTQVTDRGISYSFSMRGLSCKQAWDRGITYRFSSQVKEGGTNKGIAVTNAKTQTSCASGTLGTGAATASPCKAATIYQTICNPCQNKNNVAPAGGTSGWCCNNNLILTLPSCSGNPCFDGTYTCDGNIVACKKKTDGTACGTNKVCLNGGCVASCTNQCTSGVRQCSGTGYQTCGDSNGDGCTEWGTVTTCPTGQTCANGQCGCAAPTVLCGTSCVNTQTDNRNCGACGTICPTGMTCQNGACRTLCPDADGDGYGVGDLTACTQKVQDCDDTRSAINPGVTETVCTDNLDNDCDSGIDYDGGSQFPAKKGDNGCPVSVVALNAPSTAVENSAVEVKCTASVAGVRSIMAKVGGVLCTFMRWDATTAVFSCNAGTYSATPKQAVCSVDTAISTKSGQDQSTPITVMLSDCTRYSTATQCAADTRCGWYNACSGNLYSGGTDRCVAKNSVSYTCSRGFCGATCDSTDQSWVQSQQCDNTCQDMSTLLLRKMAVNNNCNYNTCTLVPATCPTGTVQACPKKTCTAPNTQGECQTFCLEAGNPNDGTDATCGICTPVCTCVPGYTDADNDMTNGCEYQCTPTNGGVESCDRLDNNCNGQVDENLPACCAGVMCPDGRVCVGGICTCTPMCAGKQCGPDACGGTCGTCATGQSCSNGLCVEPGIWTQVFTNTKPTQPIITRPPPPSGPLPFKVMWNPSTDADGDPITYKLAVTKDAAGQPAAETTSTEHSFSQSGSYMLTVTPHDGFEEGIPASTIFTVEVPEDALCLSGQGTGNDVCEAGEGCGCNDCEGDSQIGPCARMPNTKCNVAIKKCGCLAGFAKCADGSCRADCDGCVGKPMGDPDTCAKDLLCVAKTPKPVCDVCSGSITGEVINETIPPGPNAVKAASVTIDSLNAKVGTATDGTFSLPLGDKTGTFLLKYTHPLYAGNLTDVTLTAVKCAVTQAPRVRLELCGNGRADTGENCATCPSDWPCGTGQGCRNGQCVDNCQSGGCISACPAGLITGPDKMCACNTARDGKCGCDDFCTGNAVNHDACNTCTRVCGNPANREADPDCASAGLVLTNRQVSIDVPAENVITLEKLAMYKGKPVKVKVVMWSKEK